MVKKTILVIVLAVAVLSIMGCKTVQGVGNDITWVGEKAEQAVER